MTPDVARLRKLVACMRELADRLAQEVERVEEQDKKGSDSLPIDRPALHVVR